MLQQKAPSYSKAEKEGQLDVSYPVKNLVHKDNQKTDVVELVLSEE